MTYRFVQATGRYLTTIRACGARETGAGWLLQMGDVLVEQLVVKKNGSVRRVEAHQMASQSRA
jgi:hypothetical protein